MEPFFLNLLENFSQELPPLVILQRMLSVLESEVPFNRAFLYTVVRRLKESRVPFEYKPKRDIETAPVLYKLSFMLPMEYIETLYSSYQKREVSLIPRVGDSRALAQYCEQFEVSPDASLMLMHINVNPDYGSMVLLIFEGGPGERFTQCQADLLAKLYPLFMQAVGRLTEIYPIPRKTILMTSDAIIADTSLEKLRLCPGMISNELTR